MDVRYCLRVGAMLVDDAFGSLPMTIPATDQIEAKAESLPTSKVWFWATLATSSALLAYVVFLCVQWSYEATRWNTNELSCRTNLRLLSVALYNYHDQYGSFPPAYIPDADGNPMHSWRVLILPFMDESELYEKYDFDEPWDGPHNRRIAEDFPKLRDFPFRCDGIHSEADPGLTNYVAIVGKRAAWRGDEGVSLSAVTDKADQTILLVETRDSDILWTEPRDFTVEDVKSQFKHLAADDFHLTSPEWFWERRIPFISAMTVDGAVVGLPASLDDEMLNGLVTVNGGERIDEGQIVAPLLYSHWETIRLTVLPIALFVLIAIVVGLLTKKIAIAFFGGIGALSGRVIPQVLGLVIAQARERPNFSTAEGYARYFESRTFDHVVYWNIAGLIIGIAIGVAVTFFLSRRGNPYEETTA